MGKLSCNLNHFTVKPVATALDFFKTHITLKKKYIFKNKIVTSLKKPKVKSNVWNFIYLIAVTTQFKFKDSTIYYSKNGQSDFKYKKLKTTTYKKKINEWVKYAHLNVFRFVLNKTVSRFLKSKTHFMIQKPVLKWKIDWFLKVKTYLEKLYLIRKNLYFYKSHINALLYTLLYRNNIFFLEFIKEYLFVLGKKKRQTKLFWEFNNFIKAFRFKLFGLQGIKLIIKGKINGRMRKKKRTVVRGTLAVNTFKTFVHYTFGECLTKFGTFGIKLWIVYL